MSAVRETWVCHLGTVPYEEGVAIQQDLRARRQAGELPDTLLLLEHPPVYTVGRRARRRGAAVRRGLLRAPKGSRCTAPTAAGGSPTTAPASSSAIRSCAAPDVIEHLRAMERAILAALAETGVQGRGRVEDGPDYTGVWVGDRKIASLGVHVSRGISTHGFAVNVENDLEPFSLGHRLRSARRADDLAARRDRRLR